MYTEWYQAIDTPPTVFTSDLMSTLFDSIRFSMRSTGTVGLLSFGVIISVIIIIRIFGHKLFEWLRLDEAVKKREFSRKVDTEDMERNSSDIIENQMMKRIISHHVGSLWRSRFRKLDVADAVYRKEVNLEATERFTDEHEDEIVSSKARQLAINKAAAKHYYNSIKH